jgi:hypothetical protein
VKLGKPALGDTNWDQPLTSNIDSLDAIAPLSGLLVTPTEIPSASLNVAVAPGKFRRSTGQIVSFAGSTSQTIPASTTKVLYLDSTGTVQVAASYPSSAHVRLATVVAGTATITSITDDRISAVELLGSYVSAANDTAAASAGVPAGCTYRDRTGVLRVQAGILANLAPLASLAVTPAEIPSASLNVAVAAGKFRRCTGEVVAYAGTTSQAIPASTTKVLYLDSTGALQVASSYPTTAHTRLATVTAGTSTITAINSDDRISAVEILGSYASAADDTAAAAANVPIGCLYQDGTGVVRVRLT